MNIVLNFLKSVARIMGSVLTLGTKALDDKNKKMIDLNAFKAEFMAKSKANITKINLEINNSNTKIQNNERSCKDMKKIIIDNVQAISVCKERIEELAKQGATREFTFEERTQMDKLQSDQRIMNMVIARNMSSIEAKTISTTRTKENIIRLNRILQENTEKTISIQFELEELIQERETNALEFSLDDVTLGGYKMEELREIIQSENNLALAKRSTNELLDEENTGTTAKKYNADTYDAVTDTKVQDLINKHRAGGKVEDILSENLEKVIIETKKTYA